MQSYGLNFSVSMLSTLLHVAGADVRACYTIIRRSSTSRENFSQDASIITVWTIPIIVTTPSLLVCIMRKNYTPGNCQLFACFCLGRLPQPPSLQLPVPESISHTRHCPSFRLNIHLAWNWSSRYSCLCAVKCSIIVNPSQSVYKHQCVVGYCQWLGLTMWTVTCMIHPPSFHQPSLPTVILFHQTQ